MMVAMMTTNHYSILGIDSQANDEQIKKAYHVLAKKFHPDKNKSPGAEDKFKTISTSYAILMDRDKRRIYDMQREADAEKAKSHPQQPHTPTSQPKSSPSGGSTTTTGWERFRQSSTQSSSTGPNRTSKQSESTFDKKKSSQQQEAESSRRKQTDSSSNRRTFRRHTMGDATDLPEWNNNFTDGFWTDFDKLFEKFYAHDSNGCQNNSSDEFKFTYKCGLEDMDSDTDETTEMFDIGLRLHNASPKRSSLDDMWDWSVPLFNKKNHRRVQPFNEDVSRIRLPCVYCGRSLDPAGLTSHEEICKRFYAGGSTKTSAQSQNNADNQPKIVDSDRPVVNKANFAATGDFMHVINSLMLLRLLVKTRSHIHHLHASLHNCCQVALKEMINRPYTQSMEEALQGINEAQVQSELL